MGVVIVVIVVMMMMMMMFVNMHKRNIDVCLPSAWIFVNIDERRFDVHLTGSGIFFERLYLVLLCSPRARYHSYPPVFLVH